MAAIFGVLKIILKFTIGIYYVPVSIGYTARGDTIHYTVYSIHYTECIYINIIYVIKYTIYSVKCIIQYTMYIIYFIHTVYCVVYIVYTV